MMARRSPHGARRSTGMAQFGSDVTDGRYPRAALALAGGDLLAVACDGRADDEAA